MIIQNRIIVCTSVLVLLLSFSTVFASGAEELPGLSYAKPELPQGPVQLSGTIINAGDSRDIVPVLLLDAESIRAMGGTLTSAVVFGGDSEAIEMLQFGQVIEVNGILISSEQYKNQYKDLYPLNYQDVQAYIYIGELSENQ